MTVINDYWAALNRLQTNSPIHLPKGSPINNDTVALEAGRKRGSIKKSRKIFIELISAINEISFKKELNPPNLKTKLLHERSKKSNYRNLYHQALNRELMLLDRLAILEKQLKQYDNITPIFK